jgi:hypothetical protein
VAFHEECKRYPLGTRGITPPILASMNNGAGKATNQSGFNALLVWERNLVQVGRHRVQLVRRVAQEPSVRGSNPSGARVQWNESCAEPSVGGSNPYEME